MALDVGVRRITYGVVLPALARDLHLSLTAAGKFGALALCRASHVVFACAMLVPLTARVVRRCST
jgi:hypothetical protein